MPKVTFGAQQQSLGNDDESGMCAAGMVKKLFRNLYQWLGGVLNLFGYRLQICSIELAPINRAWFWMKRKLLGETQSKRLSSGSERSERQERKGAQSTLEIRKRVPPDWTASLIRRRNNRARKKKRMDTIEEREVRRVESKSHPTLRFGDKLVNRRLKRNKAENHYMSMHNRCIT